MLGLSISKLVSIEERKKELKGHIWTSDSFTLMYFFSYLNICNFLLSFNVYFLHLTYFIYLYHTSSLMRSIFIYDNYIMILG